MMYHDTLSCIAILQGIIYSQSVTVILEYVNLLSHIGSRVFAATRCLSWLCFIVTSMVFNTWSCYYYLEPNIGLLVYKCWLPHSVYQLNSCMALWRLNQ